MHWFTAHRASGLCRTLADRHYSRQKPGTPQFVPPGRCLVLYAETASGRAYWVTSYPFAQYVKHEWAGAWVCQAFRNERCGRASDLIVEAVAATRHKWPEVPDLGMVTFIDPKKVKPIKVRGKDTWGYTYLKAGFKPCGKTKGGLLAFQLMPNCMPAPQQPMPYPFSEEGMKIWLNQPISATPVVTPGAAVLASR